ncbi:hypothetical protein RGUI_3371 [Rhodovulum sp. P5]|uniref:hypothetical protein n=1 Tax=Rhodovulum sp. P5 TaxID=1564506 RepID=UPI0009C2EC96|nr:hypothetical protein [Rhodovulum sp. P5]ARE41512.1 hypothetical protein RGUI_3371 [Rhodovulum sp. P5]
MTNLKFSKAMAFGLCSSLVALMAVPASALTVRITDNTASSFLVADGGALDADGIANNEVTFECAACGGVAGWSSVSVDASATPAANVGLPGILNVLNLSVDATSPTVASLVIEATQTGMTFNQIAAFWEQYHQATGNVSNTTGGGTYSIEAWYDASNTAFGYGSQIDGTFAGGTGVAAFSASDSDPAANTTFSMTTRIEISHFGSSVTSQIDSQAHIVASEIPVPAAGFLLVGALGLIGAASRRKG